MAILQIKLTSQALSTKTDVVVILPTKSLPEMQRIPNYGFYQDGMVYQVLYLYHGTTGDCFDWIRFSMLEKYAQDHCLAVVLPSVQNSNVHNIPDGCAYFDYVAEELPRMISWMLPVSRRRADTFIGGISMGGAAAFKLAMDRPDRFAAAACLSPAFFIPELIESGQQTPWSAAYAPGETLKGTAEDPYWQAKSIMDRKIEYPELYLCCGTEDELCLAGTRQFHSYLEQIGMHSTYHEQAGVHDWEFWNDELKRILAWLPLQNGLVHAEMLGSV